MYPRPLHLAERVQRHGQNHAIFMQILMSLRGMTISKAIAISDVCPVMGNLIRYYESLSWTAGTIFLRDIRDYYDGQPLGLELSARVYLALYANTDPNVTFLTNGPYIVPEEWENAQK